MSETVTLQPGDTAPSFTLSDENGASVSLSDYRGKKVIVYFYPAASTPGCTTEACDFRDNLNSLGSAGYQVLGLSKDELPALVKFKDEEGLTFPLLSDPGLETHKAYGAWGEKSLYGNLVTGTLRSTFVVDEAGRIELALYNVKATGHVAMLRKRLGLDA
ncbi:peroxiredoxin Q/BCP [Cryobacterium mesophilum]|uniref:thioredoxin-dependent peroxiredoxin n=1 Tax=Terrimesophilobacter mesophilus TaxID=433647 RepID=A0A4R8V9J8_9MICO|nr:thioredoxin-dependent thiol peroxidase [Terrimesophilobacter mesophilus]MBB5632608.1 peroxiredoxin Q/BCP [Terrimesophilobacter mesophilus]TFB79423.1 thioredoxin-dependent thiol peroxidase [Terrimesophilobacter mesophilus]